MQWNNVWFLPGTIRHACCDQDQDFWCPLILWCLCHSEVRGYPFHQFLRGVGWLVHSWSHASMGDTLMYIMACFPPPVENFLRGWCSVLGGYTRCWTVQLDRLTYHWNWHLNFITIVATLLCYGSNHIRSTCTLSECNLSLNVVSEPHDVHAMWVSQLSIILE